MNAQTHYPDCWRDPHKHPECALRRINELEQEALDWAEEIRRLWQPYTQQNVDRMSLEDLVADMIKAVKESEQENEELRHDIRRQSAALTVELEANNALRSKLNEAQRELGRMEAKQEELERRSRTRPDYDLRCGDCGAPHWLDTSLPSNVWNRIASPDDVLCLLCIDERLAKTGMECGEAEFYFVGEALSSKLYEDSHGDVECLKREIAQQQKRIGELESLLGDLEKWFASDNGYSIATRIAQVLTNSTTPQPDGERG